MIPETKKTWAGKCYTVTLGATAAEGGSRTSVVKIGGASTLPFLHFEGTVSAPKIALEVWDVYPEEWPELLKQSLADADLRDPGKWAAKCQEYGADLVCLRLAGCHPERGNRGPADAVATAKAVLQAVGVPLIVWGTGNADKDNEIFPAVAEALAGENCLLGTITEDNYKTLVAVCTAYKHKLIAESPCDVNMAKQVNILATDMGFAAENLVIYPTSGALGYGLEYIYSVMERARLAALKGDRMLAQPMLCDIGIEVWGVKEAKVSEEEVPEWGSQACRAPLWEASTVAAYLQSGADLVVLRHPQAIQSVRATVAGLMGTGAQA